MAAADLLVDRSEEVLAANSVDIDRAEAAGASATVVDRLRLSPPASRAWPRASARLRRCPTRSARSPTGGCVRTGYVSRRVRVPLGVVAIVYENRPNVTSDAAGLCVKSGNAAFLRGSSGAISSNIAIAAALREGLREGRPAIGQRDARRGHQPRGGGRVHANARRHRLPHPSRRAVAHRQRPRERDSALRHRRRRQLPHLRGRDREPAEGIRDRPEREAATPVGVQRDGDAARAPFDRGAVPEAGRPRSGQRRARRRRRHSRDPRCRSRRSGDRRRLRAPSSSR